MLCHLRVNHTYRRIIDSLGNAVLVIDADNYAIVDVNPEASKQLKLTKQELVGKTCYQVSHQRTSPCPEQACPIRMALKNMKPCTVEHQHFDKNNNMQIVEITTFPLLSEERTTVIHISKDITEQKQLIKKIQEDEKRYHALFDHAPLGILIIDPQLAAPVEFNELAHKQLGYTREEFTKLRIQDYKYKRTRNETKALIDKILQEGKIEFEDKHVTKNGDVRDVIVISQAIELSGKTYLQSIYRDITEAKEVELALMESETMYRLLVENAREGVWALNGNNRTVYVNPKMAKMLHYTESEMRGKTLNEFLDKKDTNAAKNGWSDYIGNQGEWEFIFRRKDGIRIYALVSFSAIEDDDGCIKGTLALVTDITLRRAMEEKLEAYSKNLEQTVKQRTDQLLEAQSKLVKAERLAAIGEVAAMVGHDLRNPLTGINGAVFYLKKKLPSNLEPEALQMLDVIERDIQYANAIITDLMDYSRELKIELSETTPKRVIAESISLVNIPKDIRIVDASGNSPTIQIDVGKMQRVFANFIKNAIEAMPKGGELSIQSRTIDGMVEFKIADCGCGISAEVLEKMWMPFFTTKAKGMGLGLAICKGIIDAHEGKVCVESTIGQGTAFTVTLPINLKPKK